jgi:hypothetical protein
MSEEEVQRMNVRVRENDPDVYKVMKMMYAQRVNGFKGNDEGREFMKYVSPNLILAITGDNFLSFKLKWIEIDYFFGYFSLISSNF